MENNSELLLPTYHVELLSSDIPQLDNEKLLKDFNAKCGKTNIEADTDEYLVFAFEDFPIDNGEGNDFPKCVIFKEKLGFEKSTVEESIKQTWDWPEKEKFVRRCKYKTVFSDFLATGLDNQQRLKLFNNSLLVVIKNIKINVINWVNSTKLVYPDNFVSALSIQKAPDYLYGALNVRLYVVDESKQEFIMDTLGLCAFGLPDLQCSFKELNPEDVAGVLINYGYYIFEKGDIIENGNTVQGIDEDQKWSCQHEVSLVNPSRYVIDFNPGESYMGSKTRL